MRPFSSSGIGPYYNSARSFAADESIPNAHVYCTDLVTIATCIGPGRCAGSSCTCYEFLWAGVSKQALVYWTVMPCDTSAARWITVIITPRRSSSIPGDNPSVIVYSPYLLLSTTPCWLTLDVCYIRARGKTARFLPRILRYRN